MDAQVSPRAKSFVLSHLLHWNCSSCSSSCRYLPVCLFYLFSLHKWVSTSGLIASRSRDRPRRPVAADIFCSWYSFAINWNAFDVIYLDKLRLRRTNTTLKLNEAVWQTGLSSLWLSNPANNCMFKLQLSLCSRFISSIQITHPTQLVKSEGRQNSLNKITCQHVVGCPRQSCPCLTINSLPLILIFCLNLNPASVTSNEQ